MTQIAWKRRLIGTILASFIKVLRLSFRVKFVKPLELDLTKPYIYALWHGEQFIPLMLFPKFLQTSYGGIVSTSKDGDILAACLESLGYTVIRGSSSKQGARALLSIMRIANQGYATGFALDGPRGPRGVIKPGIIYLAQKTGQPIVPVSYSVAKKYIFHKAWDKFEVPFPGQKITFTFGEPINIPGSLTKEQVDEMCVYLAQHMART